MQVGLNSVVEIIESFALLGARLDMVSKLLGKSALTTVVREVGVDWCGFGDIPFLWLVLVSGGNGCSSVVAWSDLCLW